MNDNQIIALIRDQVRSTVDPVIMKLRQELYGTDITFGRYISDDKISPTAAQNAAEAAIEILNAGGQLVNTWNEFPVDGTGIQSGKAVTYNGTVASHADCTNSAHVGHIVGIATSPGSPGDVVKVQTYGILDFSEIGGVWAFSGTGPVMVGTNGNVVLTLPSSPVFSHFVGFAIAPAKVFVMINPDSYLF
jgi:hypothetical protein